MRRHFRRIPPAASAHESGPDLADRILSGSGKEQVSPEWSAVQDLVRALRATADGGTAKENERETVAAIAAIVQRGDRPKKYRSRILRGSVSPVVVAVGLFAGGAIAAAATGSLPTPVQRVASRVMSQVGIDIPTPSAAAHPESVPLRAPEPTPRCGPVVPRCLPVARHPTTRHSTVISPGKRAPASEHRPSRGSGAVKKSGAGQSGGAKAGGSHGSGAVKKSGAGHSGGAKTGVTHRGGAVKKKSGAGHSGGAKTGVTHGSGAVKKKNGAGHSGGAKAGVTHSDGKVHKKTSAGHAGGLKKKGGGAKTGGSHGSGGGKSTNPPSGGGGKKGS